MWSTLNRGACTLDRKQICDIHWKNPCIYVILELFLIIFYWYFIVKDKAVCGLLVHVSWPMKGDMEGGHVMSQNLLILVLLRSLDSWPNLNHEISIYDLCMEKNYNSFTSYWQNLQYFVNILDLHHEISVYYAMKILSP